MDGALIKDGGSGIVMTEEITISATASMDTWRTSISKIGTLSTLKIEMRSSTAWPAATYTDVCTLPEGHRPPTTPVYRTCVTQTGVPIVLFINTSGKLQIRANSQIKDYVRDSFSFYTG